MPVFWIRRFRILSPTGPSMTARTWASFLKRKGNSRMDMAGSKFWRIPPRIAPLTVPTWMPSATSRSPPSTPPTTTLIFRVPLLYFSASSPNLTRVWLW